MAHSHGRSCACCRLLLVTHRLGLRFNLAGNGQLALLSAPLLLTRLAQVAVVAVDALPASRSVNKRTRLAATDVVTCRSQSWKLSGTKLWLLPLLLWQWGHLKQPMAKKQTVLLQRWGHRNGGCTSVVCLYLLGHNGTACK